MKIAQRGEPKRVKKVRGSIEEKIKSGERKIKRVRGERRLEREAREDREEV